MSVVLAQDTMLAVNTVYVWLFTDTVLGTFATRGERAVCSGEYT